MKFKIILIFIIILMFQGINAQVKQGTKKNLAKLFLKEDWENLALKTERMVLQQKYMNDPEVLLYLGYSYNKIFILCLEKPELLDKYPEYLNSYQIAVNYSIQAKRKDRKAKIFFPDNDSLLEDVAITAYYYIDNYVNEKKRYPKANSLLTKILRFYTDDNILFLKAVMCAMTNNDIQANEIFDSVFNKLSNSANKKTVFYSIEAFDYYTHYLINKEIPDIDSARNFINRGLLIYPDNELLLYLSEYIENPLTDKIKPKNIKRAIILKDIDSFADENKDDDDEKTKKARREDDEDDT